MSMPVRSRLVAAWLLLVLAVPCSAQDVNSCNAILADGVRDQYDFFTLREQFELYQKRLCDAKFSSYESFRSGASSLKLDVPLAEGLLGLDGSTESKSSRFQQAYSNYCESTYASSEIRSVFASQLRRVSEALANSWGECHRNHLDAWMELNKTGIFVSFSLESNFRDFTVTVNRRGNIDTRRSVTINDVHPSGRVSCVREGRLVVPRSKVALNQFSMTCTKEAHHEISFSISTDDGVSNALRVPAETSKLSEMEERLQMQEADLRATIERLRARTDDRFDGFQFEVKYGDYGNGRASAPECSAGFRDAGATIYNTWPGGCCGRGNVGRLCYKVN